VPRRLTPRRFKRFATQRYHLQAYLQHPGDGRLRPQIPAAALLWALLIGQVLREWSFAAIEALVRSPARRALAVARAFSNDALAYFTERLWPERTRQALAAVLQQAKRNKGFDDSRFLGLALDGTASSRSAEPRCALCRPVRDAQQVLGYRHELALISLVSDGALSLPFDLEPYGPGDSEYAASQRLLERAVAALGPRFADYVVADGEYATAPFLHAVQDRGLWVVARLKANLPLLHQAAEARFRDQPPSHTFEHHGHRIELWDADDFDPWDTLRWTSVRVLRYRQYQPDGTVVEADWLTNAPASHVGSRALYRMAKSRWQVENQGFNDAKNRHGLEHLCHHHANSLLVGWLVMLLALCLERLYRLRYLHRGTHPVRSAIDFVRALRLSLGAWPPRPRLNNSS
jgi:Transposase DDE domain